MTDTVVLEIRQNEVELGHVPIRTLQPAKINDKIYRPVDEDDPKFLELVESIRAHGLLEPIVITTDRVIISGHRRHAACLRIGMKHVACRMKGIYSGDPRFVEILVAHNEQRVKSIDEQMREALVKTDPEEAYLEVQQYRRRKAKHEVGTISIQGRTHRAAISPAKQPLLSAVQSAIAARRKFWPLTDRRIHYDLVTNPVRRHASKPTSMYQNDNASYKDLCNLLTRARVAGLIPWEAIHDPTRPFISLTCHREPSTFMKKEMDQLFKGYYRDLQQSQPNHIEIIGEKTTIQNIIEPVALEFCIPLTIGRGYSSLQPRHEMVQRFLKSGKERLVLLVVSDFDPEGEDIPHSFARSLRDDFELAKVDAIKVALTWDQVQSLKLPPNNNADKKKDGSRYKSFVARYGSTVYELEALEPEALQGFLRETIVRVMDVDAYNAEVDSEKRDAARLSAWRRTIKDKIGTME